MRSKSVPFARYYSQSTRNQSIHEAHLIGPSFIFHRVVAQKDCMLVRQYMHAIKRESLDFPYPLVTTKSSSYTPNKYGNLRFCLYRLRIALSNATGRRALQAPTYSEMLDGFVYSACRVARSYYFATKACSGSDRKVRGRYILMGNAALGAPHPLPLESPIQPGNA